MTSLFKSTALHYYNENTRSSSSHLLIYIHKNINNDILLMLCAFILMEKVAYTSMHIYLWQ